MLFLLRPPQTWMPYSRPRTRMQQDAYYHHILSGYESTRQVPTYDPSGMEAHTVDVVGRLKDLAELHRAGSLTDQEFADAKATLLGGQDAGG